MGAILLFLGVIIIGTMITIHSDNKNNEEFYSKVDKSIPCNYYGGFRTVSGCNRCDIYCYKDKTKIGFKLYKDSQGVQEVIKTIPVNIIKGCEIVNTQQVQEKIALGKMLVFGLPALAMKGNKNILTQEFVKIDIQDNDGSIISVLLKVKILKNSDLVNMINEVCGFNYL